MQQFNIFSHDSDIVKILNLIGVDIFRPPIMEGDSPELEIDSELVMSFYDQYQV